MGLGSLLLNTDQVVTRLQPSRLQPVEAKAAQRRRRPAAARAASRTRRTRGASDSDPEPDVERHPAEFVVLWPALGCPGLVHPEDRALEVIFLSKLEPTAITRATLETFVRQITVLEWNQARLGYVTDGAAWDPRGWALSDFVDMNALTLTSLPQVLSEYKERVKLQPQTFGNLLHTVSDVVPKVYLAKGFRSIVSCRLPLLQNTALQPEHMYTLYYAEENGLLRDILRDDTLCEKPYADIPLMGAAGSRTVGGPDQIFRGKSGTRERQHWVRLFHPFWLVKAQRRNYLNVGHLTDLHSSTLWDFMEKRIFPGFDFDGQDLATGRSPASAFQEIAGRYNNPNLNARSLTQLFNRRQGSDFVDIILATGDLIDFNRGFNHAETHSPDNDYIFNLNWVRFYELLLLDYERPTFTLLGNHDWRLNPYPPRIKLEWVHYLLILYLGLVVTGMGTVNGSLFGAALGVGNNGASEGEGLGAIGLFLLAPIAGSLLLFASLLLVASIAIDADTAADLLFSAKVGGAVLAVGVALGILLIAVMGIVHGAKDGYIKDASIGAVLGTIVGGGFGAAIAIAGLFFIPLWHMNYMSHIVNLEDLDFDRLIPNNVAYLNVFGRDGLFHMTERSFDWYALVVNPFQDYGFRYGNMHFMMADWGGSEVLVGDPPLSDDSFTPRQWQLLQQWIESAVTQRQTLQRAFIRADQQQVVPLVGLHTPVFCPMVSKDLIELHRTPSDVGDDDLKRGTMEEHRQDLIDLFFKLSAGTYAQGVDPIPAISLTGHTHTPDIFHMPDAEHVVWYDTAAFESARSQLQGKGLHITTGCGGPPSDGKNPSDNPAPGDRSVQSGSARVVSFDPQTGRIAKIEQIFAATAKSGDA